MRCQKNTIDSWRVDRALQLILIIVPDNKSHIRIDPPKGTLPADMIPMGVSDENSGEGGKAGNALFQCLNHRFGGIRPRTRVNSNQLLAVAGYDEVVLGKLKSRHRKHTPWYNFADSAWVKAQALTGIDRIEGGGRNRPALLPTRISRLARTVNSGLKSATSAILNALPKKYHRLLAR